MSSFDFVPRKLSKSTKDASKQSSFTPVATQVSSSTSARNPTKHTSLPQSAGETLTKFIKGERLLDDTAYAALLCLALSDYALWSNPDFRQALDFGNEGYVSLRYLLHTSPVLANLTPHPPETILMRSIRSQAAHYLEARMVVLEPTQMAWYGQEGRAGEDEGGGYEVRRKEWDSVRERIRMHTTMQWEKQTIYIENLPHNTRTVSAIYQLLHELLLTESSSSTRSPVQSISFPPHRDDKPDAPAPPKCKGFAFVVLADLQDVDHLLQNWPWDRQHPIAADSDNSKSASNAVTGAMDAGFRCLSKKRWDKLKDEYLMYQQELLDLVVEPDEPFHGEANEHTTVGTVHDDTRNPPNLHAVPAKANAPMVPPPPRPQSPPSLSYPPNCLVSVKNLHMETNKTTLRALFSVAFEGGSDGIDYVDFSKGMDSCFLRLATATHARALTSYFATHAVTQGNGLDGTGTHHPERIPGGSIEMELVQGRREEIYWEKVPEKIKRQAVARAQAPGDEAQTASASQAEMANDEDAGRPKRKRRKRA